MSDTPLEKFLLKAKVLGLTGYSVDIEKSTLYKLENPVNLTKLPPVKIIETQVIGENLKGKVLVIPDTVEIISKYAFILTGRSNTELEDIILNDNIKVIGNGAFARSCYKSFENLKLPKNLEKLETGAFIDSDIVTLVINDKLEEIGDSAFESCNKLEKITLGKNLRIIENNSFMCNSLSEIIFNDALEVIGVEAFYETKLKNLKFPNSLKRIDIKAFAESELQSIEIPESMEFIGGGAFYRCAYLSEVILPNKQIDISGSAFEQTPFIKNYFKKYTSLISGRQLVKVGKVSHFEIQKGIAKISEGCFRNNRKIEIVTLNNYITEIPDNCFRSCHNLILVKNMQSIKSIGSYSFYMCKNLEEVELPEGIEKIPVCAFRKCANLRKIKLPSTIKVIEPGAFAETSIEELIIPEGTEIIYDDIVAELQVIGKVHIPHSCKILKGFFEDQQDYYDAPMEKNLTEANEIMRMLEIIQEREGIENMEVEELKEFRNFITPELIRY